MNQLEVSVAIAHFLKERRRGRDPRLAEMTLGDWVDSVYFPSIDEHRSKKTAVSRFNTHIRPILGDRPINQISAGDLVSLVDSLRPSPKGNRKLKKLAASTKNRVTDQIKAIFSKLHDLEIISENIGRRLVKHPERNQRGRILLASERQAFFIALASASMMVQLLIWLLILTGMRLNEALSAKWSFVDFENRLIRLPDTKSGHPRVVPLSDLALIVCQKLWTLKSNDYLFPG